MKFSKLLTNARIQNEIINQLKSCYFIPEHHLFLVDMDCDESYDTLEKVSNGFVGFAQISLTAFLGR